MGRQWKLSYTSQGRSKGYINVYRRHALSENVDILYRRSCILEHLKAYFERFLLYFAAFAKTKKYILFLNVNSPHKIKSKIIENLPFCIQDIFITWT